MRFMGTRAFRQRILRRFDDFVGWRRDARQSSRGCARILVFIGDQS
jgi:hypothetical protein